MSLSPRWILAVSSLTLGLLLLLGTRTLPEDRYIGHFSTAEVDSTGHPASWTPISFGDVEKKTRYQLVQRSVQGDTMSVVQADSDGGAAGLGREVRLEPRQYPILTWRWKVENVLKTGNARQKDGDDYPARIYVTFDYDPGNFGFLDRAKYEALQALGYDQIPTRALNYIWASKVEKGTVLQNPFTDWVQMIAVESGSTNVGTWVVERRNIRADYRKAFGKAPPPINGIAIMTDTDNTGESATAYYGDIVAEPRAEIKVELPPTEPTQ